MEEDYIEIGAGKRMHRFIHLVITIPAFIFIGVMTYYLASSPRIQEDGWGVVVFAAACLFMLYCVILYLLTRTYKEETIITDKQLTFTHRTMFLTIPFSTTIWLCNIASMLRDDKYLYLYDNRHNVLLKISDRINETKQIADELKKRLPNVEYKTQSDVLTNARLTYTVPSLVVVVLYIGWIALGVYLFVFMHDTSAKTIIGWCLVMWLIIYNCSQTVVIKGDKLTYTGRSFFMTPIDQTINISDVASLSGSRRSLFLLDKKGNCIMDIHKNVFFIFQLGRTLEILICNREKECNSPCL